MLARRVRLLSIQQVANTWWSTTRYPTSLAAARLAELARGGHLVFEQFRARPGLPVREPLATWQPGLPMPNLASIAYRAGARWKEQAARLKHCAVATRETGNRFGGRGGRFPRGTEVTHDIHLSSVYLRMRSDLPSRAATWCHEDLAETGRARGGEKVPDAIVRDGLHHTAIEWVGSYPKKKLEEFHAYCEEHRLAYELW